MDFTKDQKKEAYKKLDEKQKEFVSSDEFTQSLQAIGDKHNLLLDKTGILSDIIFAIILGLVKVTDINSLIDNKLGISGQKQSELIKDINEKVFLPFRKILMEEKVDVQQTTETASITSEPTRESILAEIENPTPSIHPISAADQTVAGPAVAREILPETKSTVARDFIGSKLTETVSLPAQKAAVTLKAPEKPKSYATDPYREALN